MTANLLTLNSSKTEFLLIRLINQLAKNTTLHLTPPTLLKTLALSLMNILQYLTKLYLSKPVTITFVSFVVSCLTSIRQLPVPLLPLSFTPNLITVILSTINSLSLNYPISSRSTTLLLILSLKLLRPVISPPSCALSTGSESLNASNTSSSHLPTKFSQLSNVHTFITSSLFNVLAIIALHPAILLLGHRHHPLPKLMIARFVMLHNVSRINSLYLVNLIQAPVPPFLTHLFLHPSLLPLLIHHSAHP